MDLAELSKQIGVDLVKDAADLEPVEGEFKFKIFTRDREGKATALKAWSEKDETTGEDNLFLSGVASSTIKDLHGDTMLPSALIDMEASARNNLTIFGNHSYKVPEDVYGSVVAASIKAADVLDANGSPLYDLDFEKIRINRRNARAVESWQAMNDGTKLGLSIGARIPEGGAVRNKKTGALLIAHVDLMETSVVGIPANPRSWIDAATKSLKGLPIPPDEDDGDTAIELHVSSVVPAATATAGAAATISRATEITPGGTETIVPVDTAAAAGDPSTNTDAPSQDAQQSQPENDGAVATPDVIAAATDVLERTADEAVTDDTARDLLTEAHNSLISVTEALIAADAALDAATKRAETAEAERDEMRLNTENVIREVANLIEQVGNLPAGRQASFKAIQQAAAEQAIDWESMGLVPEVVRMLQRSPE